MKISPLKLMFWVALVVFLVVDVMILGLVPGKEIAVLMYHQVAERAGNKLQVSEKTFRMQMMYLEANGHQILTPAELKQAWDNGESGAKKTVLTFDDGHADLYDLALPVLEEHGHKGVFFIVTDWVGKPGYLDWGQIKEIASRGHIIGSHGVTHDFLTGMSLARARQEIYNSKRLLEENLGMPVRYFCYPAGRFDEDIQRVVEEAGYEMAFATSPGRAYADEDPYAVKRIKISDSSNRPLKFWLRVSGYYLFFK